MKTEVQAQACVSRPPTNVIIVRAAGWCEMFEKNYGPKWRRWARVLSFTIFAIGLAGTTVRELRGGEITGTVSKAEPPNRQEGTPMHPFANANQCPSSTDVVVWPKDGRPLPSLPPGISVCFVGTQSFNNNGGLDLGKR